jgi:hypothetical protein
LSSIAGPRPRRWLALGERSSQRSLAFLFLQDGCRAATDPCVDLMAQSQNHTASLAPWTPNGQVQLVFPSLNRSHAPVEIPGNFLPGIESIASWGGVNCRESVSHFVDHGRNPYWIVGNVIQSLWGRRWQRNTYGTASWRQVQTGRRAPDLWQGTTVRQRKPRYAKDFRRPQRAT